jgi:peptide/nickel transport system substrate-binding protein
VRPPTAVTAKNRIVLVINEEPPQLAAHGAGGGITASIHYENMSDPLTWQSGDDQRIVPTTATVGWEQVDPDTWRFQLRRGVKFHNGEPWNARAALPSLKSLGSAESESDSFGYTGAFSAEAKDDYTLDINCLTPCPVFPNTAFYVNFTAPNFLATATESQVARQNVGLGPYKQVKWDPGVSITMEAYDDYVPAGNHFEFQKGAIRDATWFWRGERLAMMAMVQAGEADMAWDVGVDAIDRLAKNQIKSGGSAETFQIESLSIINPELSKLKVRQALAHAINCQEIIDSLYGGHSTCRGNIIWPGVIGATRENTAPFTYDPVLSRRLLNEAGYDFDNVFSLISRGARIPKQVEVLEAVQAYLRDVGVKVELTIVDLQRWLDLRNCRSGRAVKDLLEKRGRNVDTSEATLEEMQAAMKDAAAKGATSCPSMDLTENEPSNETLDFGRQVTYYMNCARIQSPHCDPSPGGIQEKIAPALSATGAERVRLLEELANILHDRAFYLMGFDLPVFYAVNPKLQWEPRFDRRIRVNTMTFSP